MHLVPEAWHLRDTRYFIRKVFESFPDSRVAGVFPTYVAGNIPHFIPYIAQYSNDTGRPLWLVAFYGEPQNRHVGAIVTDEGTQQLYSLNDDFREIAAVKLPDMAPENAVPHALGELRNHPAGRVQQTRANGFRISRGRLVAYLFDNGDVVKGPEPLGRYEMKDGKIIGTEMRKRKPCIVVPAFDMAKPESSYYQTIGGAIPLSPLTGAPE